MSEQTRNIVQDKLNQGNTLQGIAEMLSETPGLSYSHEGIRRWLFPENEPRFSDMYMIAQFGPEPAAEFARAMCIALRPDLVPEGE